MKKQMNLMVEMSQSVNLDPAGKDAGSASKFLQVSLQYAPSDESDNEASDRSWFKGLIDSNPGINNLLGSVNDAACAMIEQIKPREVNMTVTLSNDVDSNGFCSKTVYFSWKKPESACHSSGLGV